MNKLKSLALILLLNASPLFADTSPFQFLNFQSSARSAGLAGCFVSMPNDANAVFFNPATIYTVKDKPLSFTFLKHVLDINSGLATYIIKNGEKGVFAEHISYTNYGSFDRADNQGNKNGTFGANTLSFGTSYSNELDSNLYYGVTAKLLWANIESQNTVALAIDAGLLYQLRDGRTNIGLSLLNIGTQLSKMNGYSESIPFDIRAGINHRLKGLPLLVNFSFHHLADNTNQFLDKFKNFSLGGELYIGKYVQARLGYDNQIRRLTSIDSDRKLSGFSGGVGVKANDFNIDYGIALMGSSATLHRFSISLNL
jgi:hypothetical protein